MKITSCLIGFTLLFSSFYMMILNKKNEIFIHFNQLLNDQQKNIYQNIVSERLKIYIIGSILGFLCAFLYYKNHQKEEYIFCKCLLILYFIKLGFYYIHPKQPLMLYSLTSKEQTDAWADIYTEMKQRWIYSLSLGFISYLFIGFAFCGR